MNANPNIQTFIFVVLINQIAVWKRGNTIITTKPQQPSDVQDFIIIHYVCLQNHLDLSIMVSQTFRPAHFIYLDASVPELHHKERHSDKTKQVQQILRLEKVRNWNKSGIRVLHVMVLYR